MSQRQAVPTPEPEHFSPVLRRLEEELPVLVDFPARLRVDRYLPRFYSDVMKVTATGSHGTRGLYVKIAKPQKHDTNDVLAARVRRVFDEMQRLHRTMSSVPGLSAVKPIVCYPELFAIVTEEAEGDTLLARLEAAAHWWDSSTAAAELELGVRRIGEWLQMFHRAVPAGTGQLRVDAMRDYLDLRLRLLSERHAVLHGDDRARLLRLFDALARRVHPADLGLVPVHADFALGNIILSRDRVVVLDFSTPEQGAWCHDVAHLHMHLGLVAAKPTFNRPLVSRLQRELLRGFSPTLAPDQPLFTLLSLQHVACHMLGLAQNPSSRLSAAYNRYLMRRHRRWLEATCRECGVA